MKIFMQNSSRQKLIELWAKYIKKFGNFGRYFPRATFAKIHVACTRVCRSRWRNFVLKIEKLSHIVGTGPILGMARAYGLRPRLWLLV